MPAMRSLLRLELKLKGNEFLDIIEGEPSLQKLDPFFLPVGLRDGFSIEKKDAWENAAHLINDRKKELVSQPQEKFLVESVVAVLYDHKNLKFRKKMSIKHWILVSLSMETSLFITNMEFVASRNLVKLIIPMERKKQLPWNLRMD